MTIGRTHRGGRIHPSLLLSVCVAFLFQTGQRLAAAPLALHTSGNQIYNSAGKPVILHGIDIPSMEWTNTGDHLLQSVNTAIHVWHAKLIRLPIAQDRWEGYMGQTDGGAAYRAVVDQVVDTASRAGVYVLVDDHWSDMGVWGSNLTQHKMPDDNSTKAWTDIATHFANNPAVLFDAYNEPHDVEWPVWHDGGSVTEGTTTYHSPGMQGLVDTIRGTGANNIIAVGGLGYAFDLTGITKGFAIKGTNIIYSTHVYPSSPKDWDSYDAAAGQTAPILVGEFGADPTGPYATFMPKVLAWIQSHHYNASAWCMHTAATPCLIADWNYTPTYAEGRYVFSWLNDGPTAPSGLATTGQEGNIALSWTGDAQTYDIYRAVNAGDEMKSDPIATGVTSTAYVDKNIPDGQTYFYQVAGQNEAILSGPSTEMGSTAGTPGGFPAPTPTFTVTGTASATTVAVGQPVTIVISPTNTGKAIGLAILVDMEVHDSANKQANQQTTTDPTIAPGQTHSFTFTWTPSAPGTYSVQAGIFSTGWSTNFVYNANIAAVTVTAK